MINNNTIGICFTHLLACTKFGCTYEHVFKYLYHCILALKENKNFNKLPPLER